MDIDEALSRIRRAGTGRHETYLLATDEDIARTEATVGKPLPNSYKRFVREFSNGAYLYGVQEVSAVGDGNEQIASIQNIYRSSLCDPDDLIPFREGGQTEYKYLIPFSLDSNGNEWCFIAEDQGAGSEYPVAYFSALHPDHQGKLYAKLPSFADWLSILVESDGSDEVIRIIYADEDDALYEELMLG